MKSEDLTLEEIIEFSDGWLGLKGRRLVLMDVRALSQLRKDLNDTVGKVRTRRILTRFGYLWGQADAAAMHRIFNWDSKEEWIRAGVRIQEIQGISKTMIKDLKLDDDSKKFEMDIVWQNSFEADQNLVEFGIVKYPICWKLVGYMSGYCSFCIGREVYFIEQKCRGRGDRICRAMGRTRDAWGDELETYLPYFEAEDINAKIMQLTKQLKKQQRELERRREQMALRGDAIEKKHFIGVRSRAFQQVVELANRVSQYDSTVLITGESGVGKEVLARYIHKNSPRKDGPFIAVNCGALPDTLLESELFGHTKGAFTGAAKERIGLFEEAKTGTIFLDEIGDVSPAMQIKLLRVIQQKEILRLGENLPRKVDVRVLAATNKNLMKEIEEENFREDLYYRLAVVEIHVPPLRERRDDILTLARFFVDRFSEKLGIPELRLDASTLDILQEYDWPGNIRELENAIERAAVVSRDGVIHPSELPPQIQRQIQSGAKEYSADLSLEELEKKHILHVLEKKEGNKTRAAEALGISPATLWRKLKQME